MAACTLKIELDDPQKTRTGGDIVTGNVVVQCDKDANCKGLEVSTAWSTHGRGNIDNGAGEMQVAFTGRWQAGQQYRYPFKLKTAVWPPTYYGTYINVSHRVQARAKLAWATDPKAEVEFPVVVANAPLDLAPSRPKQHLGFWGYLILAVLAVVFLVMAYFFILLIIPVAIIGGIVWFFKKVLPTFKTGKVQWTIEPQRLRVTDTVRGHFELTPRGNLKVNSVNYSVTCIEKCSSGSGSTRTTHTFEVHRADGVLEEMTTLPSGQRQSYDFEFRIPEGAPPSIKLVDNEVTWSVDMRIDIPRWPDWNQTVPIVVEPTGVLTSHSADDNAPSPKNLTPRSEEDKWFDQVIEQLQECGSDAERRRMVLDAISAHQFEIALTDIQADVDPPSVAGMPRGNGKWYEGYHDFHDMEVMLFVPSSIFFTVGKYDLWRGPVGILEYDDDNDMLICKAV